MQSSTGGPRIKLNRNAFKTEHEPVPKRQRLLRSEIVAPDAKVHATRSGARDARPQEPDVEIPAAAPDQVRNGCTHRNCRNKNNNCCTNNDESNHKQIRCHLHLALRFCKAKSARPPEDASGTTRDAIKPHAGSGGESVVVNEGVNKPRVETQNIHTGAPEKEDGRAAHRRSSSPVGELISDSAEDIERCFESSDKHRKTRSSIDSTTSVPLDPGEVQHCAETAGYETQDSSVAFEGEKFTAGPVHHVPPLLLRRVPVCKALASSQYVDFANKITPKEADTNDTCLVENESNDGSEGDVNSPECFSCQRTTAYVLWPRESCARTYKSWPFPRHGPPCELMTSSCTGPRWIGTSKTSDGTEISNMQVDFNGRLECTVEKNTKESLASHNGSVAIQRGQGQVQSLTRSARVLASSAQNNPEQALTVVNNQGERIQHFCNGFSQDAPRLGSVNENDPQAVMSDVMTEEKDNVTPAELITAKSYDFNDSPRNRTQCSISSKRPEDNENRDTESTSVHHPVPIPDHQQSAFHTSSCTVHPTKELQNPTMMAPSSVEPKHPSSVMEPPKDEQMSNNDVEDRIPCSLNVLHTEPIDQNTSFPTCTGGINLKTPFQSVTNKDSLSLSDEEITNLSAAKRPEEANVESLLLQNELHQIHKAKRSPSPVLAQVVTGGNLDVVRAYEDDAIVLDVIHDDPDLFGAIVTGTSRDVASKANPAGGHSGKNTCMQTKRTSLARKPNKINWDFDSETPRKNVQAVGGDDVRMENPNGFCRGEKKELAKDFKRQLSFGTKWPPGNPIVMQEQVAVLTPLRRSSATRRRCLTCLEKEACRTHCRSGRNAAEGVYLEGDTVEMISHTTAGNGVNVAKHLPSPYCWYYFSEYHSCLRTMCWFSHVPREEDEKFCMDVVQKFCRVGSPPVVQRAVEVFVAYYRTNAPGPSFSQNTANQLLTSLLNLALLRDLVSVINTLFTHKRTLCRQKEDWLALSHVFTTVCAGRHSKEELSRFCCRVTMALLKEPKDKLTLPYQPFAESVCQDVASNELAKCFLGRIGVSLMYSYHRAQDWSKGVKLLSTIIRLQLEFSTLKGLFSSESGASRCQHVTVATEFFLNSGSIEGALNTLKANEWFVSSSAWPCEQADVQNRRRVLTLLAEKTSYRDTLEVLSNLPGLKQPVDGVQASEYETVFNAHLRKCVTNQVLPVAADTFEFMLTHKIPPDTSELQQLVHKLGKQNSWIRARTLFKRALLAGYYSGVACENDSLALPCCLTEIEMTLAFEMFVTCICHQNPTDASQPLLITLKRRTGSEVAPESVYLAAGCRLLSAARIPNPKLSIRYTAVTQEQEQLFKLDRGSAAKWLSHNCSWAQKMWAGSHTHTHTHTHKQTNPAFQ
ncbi:testis- and ovary-specific PAZ domain-containing protein 1 [Silurus asotus]|uniref:Protein TOPAZ1 n=1 Tax=Silurus asotus TaxID=30991 RepID=A0AAD5AW16_SILAS|nr:testis- and ovary-specific PAZ domain-containing protein 1 [Silurus asotus]